MKVFYTDHFVLPLPDGHRFPMQKYSLLREAVQAFAPDSLEVAPAAVFVNRVIFPEDAAGCRRSELARAWQLATLARLHAVSENLFVVRDFGHEIHGRKGLEGFTKELWRIA